MFRWSVCVCVCTCTCTGVFAVLIFSNCELAVVVRDQHLYCVLQFISCFVCVRSPQAEIPVGLGMFSWARGVLKGQAGNLLPKNVRLSVLESGSQARLPPSHWGPSHRCHTWGHFTQVRICVWGWDVLHDVLKMLFHALISLQMCVFCF